MKLDACFGNRNEIQRKDFLKRGIPNGSVVERFEFVFVLYFRFC